MPTVFISIIIQKYFQEQLFIYNYVIDFRFTIWYTYLNE